MSDYLAEAILFVLAAALFAAAAGYLLTSRFLTRLYVAGWRNDQLARLMSLRRLMILTLIAILVTFPLVVGALVLAGAPRIVVLLGSAAFVYCLVSAWVAVHLTNRRIKTTKN